MKLQKGDIKFIDNYLIKHKVRYIDVRTELIDHLSTEFEENSKYALLLDFLNSKKDFISSFQIDRQSRLHWHYQKQLWLTFFKFFYTLKRISLTIVIVVLLKFGIVILSLKMLTLILIIISVLVHFSIYFLDFKNRKGTNKMQSSLFIFSIMALPSLPLYSYGQFNNYIESDLVIFMLFWLFSMLLTLAGFEIVYNLKKEIVANYKKLLIAK